MITLTGGNIQAAGGVKVPNGSIELTLEVDCTLIASPAQVVAAIPVKFKFDSTGNLSGSCKIFSNAELTPSTGYLVNFYDVDGARVNQDPVIWVFTQAANSTVDIGTMVSAAQGGPAYSLPVFHISTTAGLVAVDNGAGTTTLSIANQAAVTHQFLTAVVGNVLVSAQPAFSDLSGTAAANQLPARTVTIDFVIDGGGSVPSTGAKGQISVPVACTVSQWILTADQSGSAVIDVLRSTYAGFPTTSSIAGTDKPTLSAVQKNRNTGPLSNWGSTALVAGDELQINLNSVATCTRLNLTLVLSVPYA